MPLWQIFLFGLHSINCILMRLLRSTSLLFLASLLFFTLSSCSKPKAFEYRDIRNFSISNLGFQKSTVSMDLVYFNPNNFGVTLTNVSADIYLDKNYVGKYVLDTSYFIPKKAEFYLPSKMEVDMKNLFKNALHTFFFKRSATGSYRECAGGQVRNLY